MRLPPVPLDDITDQLHALPNSNPDQAFIRRYLCTPRQVLGVRADDLRKLARATAQANQGWDDAAWLALLDALYTGDLFEQRSLAGLLLGLLHPLRRRLDLAHLLGTRPESISRALHALADEGHIEIQEPDRILLRDIEALAKAADEDEMQTVATLKDVLSVKRLKR